MRKLSTLLLISVSGYAAMGLGISSPTYAAPAGTLTLSPSSGLAGISVNASGSLGGSNRNTQGTLVWDGTLTVASFAAGSNGTYSATFAVPSVATAGSHTVTTVVNGATRAQSSFSVTSATGSLSTATATPSPTPTAVATPTASSATKPLFGVNAHWQWFGESDVQTQLNWVLAAHLKTVRFDENWSRLEPTQGVWDQAALTGLDSTINLLTANGVQPIITFVTTPGWANSSAGDWAPPTNMDDYGTAIAFLANRYKTTNTIWEVWNEPDYYGYWSTGPSASQYASMVKSAYTHIKALAPNVTVLAGSLNHNDQTFLNGMYAAGVKGYFDGLSIHPYCFTMAPGDPDTKDNGAFSFYLAVEDSEATMASYGQSNMPIYITEVGWKVPDVSMTTRSQYMQSAVSIVESYPYVKAFEPYELDYNNDTAYGFVNNGVGDASWSAYTTAANQ